MPTTAPLPRKPRPGTRDWWANRERYVTRGELLAIMAAYQGASSWRIQAHRLRDWAKRLLRRTP